MNNIVNMLQSPTAAYELGKTATARVQWDTFGAIFGGSSFPLSQSAAQSMLARASYVKGKHIPMSATFRSMPIPLGFRTVI